MENPFIYGHLNDISEFVNRSADIERLRQNIENKINTILLSPRRWGKSSLVKVLEKKSGLPKKYVFCHIDMFNFKSDEDFYYHFSNAILHSTSSKFDELVANMKEYLSSLTPTISLEYGGLGKISFDFSSSEGEQSFMDILNLPEKIAKKKNIRLVVCIDEFQNLSRFKDPLLFQQRLRASWQHHQHVTYILYGSKRSMLSTIFEKQSMPFYKFGDVLYLKKIEASHWISYIQRRFRRSDKKISKKFAVKITELMECHTYYVLQFSHILWNNTEEQVDEKIFEKSTTDIIERNSLLYETVFENLSVNQIKVLIMLAENPKGKFTGAKLIKKYDLGTSSNVIQAMNALEFKEIIDRFEGYPMFVDPVFRLWMNVRVLKK